MLLTISEDLWTRLQADSIPVRIHSCFHHAMNLQSEQGLITLLAGGRCLQPSSILFGQPLDFLQMQFPREKLVMTKEGLFQGNQPHIRFMTPRIKKLELHNSRGLSYSNASAVRKFLQTQGENGIHGLIEGQSDNVYAEFLKPRIEEFRSAVVSGDIPLIIAAVKRLAGCGPGLTPSSDDFLCGYISVFPQTSHNRHISKVIMETAAQKTNDISAALMRNASMELFSSDILDLFSAFWTDEPGAIQDALCRVSEFGSSSGCDYLTGMYYGILDCNKKEG